MSAVTRPRGPLPRRVYWFRRTLVLLVLLASVLVAVRLFGGDPADPADAAGSPGTGPEPSAAPSASASPSQSAESGTEGEESATPTASPSPSATTKKPKKKPLPRPDGPCEDSDILVTPVVEGARAGHSVEITLALTTIRSAACTWEVTAESIFVTVSDEERTLWASQHCGAEVTTEEVVPRRTKAAEVVLRWNGRESATDCRESARVPSGTYTVAAVARGSVNVAEDTLVLHS